jgi:uncharacterized SAM-binding protein YcdF (DUF218 family)
MFFYLSKILGVFLDPFWWVMGVFVLAAVKTYKGKKSDTKFWLIGFWMLLFFSSGGPIGLLQQLWKVEGASLERKEQADLAIVLGGYAGYNQLNGDLDWHKPADRLLYPLKWYKEGRLKTILVTGGSANIFDSEKKEADLVAEWLLKYGVDSSDLLIESKSRNTLENAAYTKQMMRQDYVNVLLVTSEIHGRRAQAVFNKVGIEHTLVLVDKGPPFSASTFFTIGSENMVSWKYFVHEVLGYFVYTARGKI